MVVICGRNEALVKRLNAIERPGRTRLFVQGFVDNMHEWMVACDAIVTKAGPGTIAESMICGLPTLLNAFVPCQEEGNIAFVVDNGVGEFERNVKKAAKRVFAWLVRWLYVV